MSTNIDDRIVAMRFDNKQFESAVSDSLVTLENLKKNLDMSKAAKTFNDGMADAIKSAEDLNKKFKFDTAAEEFANLENASKKITFADLGGAIEAIKDKFSVFGTFADQVIRRVADGFVDLANKAGQVVKGMTIDQVAGGWTKYQNELGYVQQMMNATGDSMDSVYENLIDKVDRFSDETSYSSDQIMKSAASLLSIGASAEEVIPIVEGLAIATAYAGKDNAQFVRSLEFGFTQAYQKGHMLAQDWQSLTPIVSEELIQSFIDAGEAMGKISKGAVTISSFRDSLESHWLDRDVMGAAMMQWSSSINKAFDMVDSGDYDFVADALNELAEQTDGFSIKGAIAAQSAKSYAEAIDATKDAVSTGWKQIFRTVVGTYEESKDLFTFVTEELLTIFAYPISDPDDPTSLVNRLKAWLDLGGRETMLLGFLNIWTNIRDTISSVFEGFRRVFPKATGEQLYEFTERFANFTDTFKLSDKSLSNISKIVEGLVSAFRMLTDTAGAFIKPLFGITNAGNEMSTSIFEGFTTIAATVSDALTRIANSNAFKTFISTIENVVSAIADFVGKIMGYLGTLSWWFEHKFIFHQNKGNNFIEALFGATGDTVVKILKDVVDKFGELFGLDVSGFQNAMETAFGKIGDAIGVVRDVIGKIKDNFKDFFSNMRDLFSQLGPASTGGGLFAGIGTLLGGTGSNLIRLLTGMGTSVTGIEVEAGSAVDKIIGFIDKVKGALSTVGLILDGILLKLKEVGTASFGTFWENMKSTIFSGESFELGGKGLGGGVHVAFDTLANIVQLFSDLFGGMLGIDMSGATDKVINFLGRLRDTFVTVAQAIETAWSKLKEILSPIFDWMKQSLHTIVDAGKTIIGGGEEEVSPFNEVEQQEIRTRMLAAGFVEDNSLLGKLKKRFKPLFDAFAWIGDAFAKVQEDIKPKIEEFKTWFNKTTDGMFESGDKFITKIQQSPIVKFLKSVGGMLLAIWAKLKPVLDEILNYITDKINSFTEKLKQSDIDIGGALAAGGVIGGIVFLMKKLTEGLEAGGAPGSNGPFGGIIDKIREKLGALTETLEELQTKLKAEAILNIAKAIGILAVSMLALSFSNPEGIGAAIGAMMTIFGGLILVMKVLDSFESGEDYGMTMKNVGKALLNMGIAVAIISVALAAVTKVGDPNTIEKDAMVVSELMMALVLSMVILSKATQNASDMTKVGIAMWLVASAVKRLVPVIKVFAELSPDQFNQALKGISALMLGMAVVAYAMAKMNDAKANKATKDAGKSKTTILQVGTAILEIAAALLIVVSAVKMISTLSADELKTGFGLLGASLAAIALVIVLLTAVLKAINKDASEMMKVAGAIGIVATAMLAVAGAVMMIATIPDVNRALGGIIAMGALLLEIGIVLGGLTKIADTNDILKVAGAVGIMAVSMIAIAGAIAIVATAGGDIGTIGVTLGAMLITLAVALGVLTKVADPGKLAGTAGAFILMAGSLLVLAVAFKFMSTIDTASMLISMVALIGVIAMLSISLGLLSAVAEPSTMAGMAASLLLASLSIIAIAGAFMMMATIPIDTIQASLIAFCVILGEMAVLLGALAWFFDGTELLAIGGAFALMGGAVALVGVGFKQICEGLAELINLGPEGLEIMKQFIEFMISKIPDMGAAFAQVLFIEIPKALIEAIPILTEAMIDLVFALLEVFATTTPKAIETLWVFINALLDSILKNIKNVIETIGKIIVAILEGLITVIYPIVTKLIELICELIRAIGARISLILNTVMQFIIDVINGLADMIENKAVALYEALKHLVKSIAVALYNIGKAIIADFLKIGHMIMESGFIQGLADKIKAVKDKAKEIYENVMQPIRDFKEAVEAGWNFVLGFIRGIGEKLQDVANAAINMAKTAIDNLKNKIKSHSPSKVTTEIGGFFSEGFGNGILSGTPDVGEKAENLATTAVESLKGAITTGNPVEHIGNSLSEGFSLGITDEISKVQDASSSLGENAITSLKDAMGDAMLDATSFLDDSDYEPTITPVLDLSEIQNGAGAMSDLLNFDDPSVGSGLNLGSFSALKSLDVNGLASNMGSSLGSTIVNQPINFTINAAPGQSVNSIAQAVQRVLTQNMNQKGYAFR